MFTGYDEEWIAIVTVIITVHHFSIFVQYIFTYILNLRYQKSKDPNGSEFRREIVQECQLRI